MYLGTRKIRSAGRTSGSIEVTLPPELQALNGLGCRIVLRDGLQPEIVLQPDLSRAISRLEALWRKLARSLGASDVADDFAPTAFVMTLLPPYHWQRRPPLAYADIFSIMRTEQEEQEWGKAEAGALARVTAVLAAAIGRASGLEEAFALPFGDAVAYLIADVSAGFGTDFERSMAAGLSRQAQPKRRVPVLPFDDAFWLEREPALRRVFEQYLSWQNNPEQYGTARQQWYRALKLETVPGRTGSHGAPDDI